MNKIAANSPPIRHALRVGGIVGDLLLAPARRAARTSVKRQPTYDEWLAGGPRPDFLF